MKPSTLVEDFKGIFDNENVDDITSSEGLDEISSMKFWRHVIFYELISFIIIYFAFLKKAK